MARRVFPRFILSRDNSIKTSAKINLSVVGLFKRNLSQTTDGIPVKEVQIPVQWGHVAGKLWGSGDARPILALHAWQDNAGTWDPLIPLLFKKINIDRPILALDLPGHGLSSWVPPGVNYYPWEFVRLIDYVKEYYKWDKVSILSHSMGSIAGFRYSTVFPDNVDFFIAIDNLVYDDVNLVVDNYQTIIKKGQIAQTRLDKEPQSYTREELIKLWSAGTNQSVALESVPYLLERGTKPSKKDPKKICVTRDFRLKFSLANPESEKFVTALALRLKCPTLYIKAKDSPYATDDFATRMVEVMEKNNQKFEVQYLPGTHHLHLNTPEIVLPVIINFLQKHNLV